MCNERNCAKLNIIQSPVRVFPYREDFFMWNVFLALMSIKVKNLIHVVTVALPGGVLWNPDIFIVACVIADGCLCYAVFLTACFPGEANKINCLFCEVSKTTHKPPRIVFRLKLYRMYLKPLSGEYRAEAETELKAKRGVDVS